MKYQDMGIKKLLQAETCDLYALWQLQHLLTTLIKMSKPLTSFIYNSTQNGPIFAQWEQTDYTQHEYADIKDKYLINSYDQKNSSPQRKQTAWWLAESSKWCQSHKITALVPGQWWLMVPWWWLRQTGLIERAYLCKRRGSHGIVNRMRWLASAKLNGEIKLLGSSCLAISLRGNDLCLAQE